MKAAREEVEKNATEVVEGMKSRHSEELVQSDEEWYNAATNACGDQIKRLKDHIYQSRYEHDLNMVAVPDDSELFDKVILCPPTVLTWFDPNVTADDDNDEGEDGGNEGGVDCDGDCNNDQ